MPASVDGRPASRRPLVLVAGLVAIVAWQAVFFSNGHPQTTLESPYALTASGGVLMWQPEFVYFLYYLNLYPVASISTSPREYSVEGARQLIAREGRSLVMDRYWTIRYGDLAKTYLYLPHVWLKGRPVRPRMLHANALGFTIALLSLYTAFWFVGRPGHGVVLVLLMGSNPFQVHQVYANNNLLGWPITLTLLLLALHVPLMLEKPPRMIAAVGIALLSGVLLGTFRQIRTEPTLVVGAAVLVYLTATHLRLWRRVLLVGLVAATFVSTMAVWRGYFEHKYEEARRVVKAAGGHTYDGPRHPYHFFWHALWCGLGDFDRKYGYEWADVAAFSYAWPVLQRRYQYEPVGFPPVTADPWDPLTFGVYWDKDRVYARTVQEIPEYIEIVRDKVLRDITHDPLWYAGILARRVLRLVNEGTPPSLAVGNGLSVSLPGRAVWGWLAILITVALARRRDWFSLKLIAFTLPLVGTALLVYSGGGTVYYSIAHLIAFGAGLLVAWDTVGRRHARRLVILTPPFVLRASPFVLRGTRAGRRCLVRVAESARVRWWAGAASMLLLGLAAWAILGRNEARRDTALPPSDKPLTAILRFENETTRQDLVRVGDALGELLTEELRHAGVRLLDTQAVERLAADLVWWTPSGVLASARGVAVNAVADRSGAARVVAGRLSGTPRRLEACVEVLVPGPDPHLGREHCEQVDPDRLFDVPPRLAKALLPLLGLSAPSGPDRRPASVDAYLLYTDARDAVRRQMWGEAVRLLDSALEEDPQLRPAQALRARVWADWRPLGGEALQALTGAPTIGEALAILRARVSTDPGSSDALVDLGRTLIALELFDEARRVLSPITGMPGAPPEAFGLLATALSSGGELDRGYQALLQYQRRSWLEPNGRSFLADHLIRWDVLDQVKGSLDIAEYRRVQRGMPQWVLEDSARRWSVHALRSEWSEAKKIADQIMSLDDPRASVVGAVLLARGILFTGRHRQAQAFAEDVALQPPEPYLDVADAAGIAMDLRLEHGDNAGALRFIEDVRAAQGGRLDPRAAFWEPLALARLGQAKEAAEARRGLERDLAGIPGPTGPRLLARLDGELALARGDATGAVRSLSEAASLLPARGFCGDHVPIWYSLARAQLAAGKPRDAEEWLQKITTASSERLCWPIEYARSFSLLGRIRVAAGRDDEAGAAYEDFLGLWGKGDMASREREEARRFLERTTPSSPRDASRVDRNSSRGDSN